MQAVRPTGPKPCAVPYIPNAKGGDPFGQDQLVRRLVPLGSLGSLRLRPLRQDAPEDHGQGDEEVARKGHERTAVVSDFTRGDGHLLRRGAKPSFNEHASMLGRPKRGHKP